MPDPAESSPDSDNLLELWEQGLSAPRWREGARWENNQRKKHEMSLVGREAERELP